MNKENLLRMAAHIRTVPPEMFDMGKYRNDKSDLKNIHCGSSGCIIGHSIELAPELVELNRYGDIAFSKWSEDFTGIEDDDEWDYLFCCSWVEHSSEKAAKRIEEFVEKGLPLNWMELMLGEEEKPKYE